MSKLETVPDRPSDHSSLKGIVYLNLIRRFKIQFVDLMFFLIMVAIITSALFLPPHEESTCKYNNTSTQKNVFREIFPINQNINSKKTILKEVKLYIA